MLWSVYFNSKGPKIKYQIKRTIFLLHTGCNRAKDIDPRTFIHYPCIEIVRHWTDLYKMCFTKEKPSFYINYLKWMWMKELFCPKKQFNVHWKQNSSCSWHTERFIEKPITWLPFSPFIIYRLISIYYIFLDTLLLTIHTVKSGSEME